MFVNRKTLEKSLRKVLEVEFIFIPMSYSNTMTTSMAILFVDWLELLDPELVAMVPDLQQQLLFANEKLKGLPSQSVARSSQPYLLTLLTHQSSWASLQRCINCLLQPAEVLR